MDKYSCKILDLSYSDLANVLPFLHWNNWMANCYKIVLRVKLCSQRFDWSHRWGWSCVIRTAYKGTPLWTVGLSPVVYRALLKLILCVCVCVGVKPYACSMCDMRFFQRYHLARHSLTHTGMRLTLPLSPALQNTQGSQNSRSAQGVNCL